MIDIHSHLLFDIDDGSENIEKSVEMCRDAYKNGFKAVVATPHMSDYNHIASFVRERNAKIRELRSELLKQNIPLTVASGAELYLSDEIFSADSLDKLTINGSRYMLCEFPLGQFDISRATMWMDELLDRGCIPILAHPERYLELHRNLRVIDELLDRGVIFQVNIDSLSGKNGERPQAMAVDMVERKIARIIATDAHETVRRHNRLREKLKDLPREITDEMLIECMRRVPRAILKNEEIN